MDTLQPSPARSPSAPPEPGQHASHHLGAIAARLTARGVPSRLTSLYGTPVLTIEEPAAPGAASITLHPDPASGHDVPLEGTCLWTPDPAAAPEITADTIITILHAIRPANAMPGPGPDTPPPSTNRAEGPT